MGDPVGDKLYGVLPKDYYSLTSEGKRLARVAACTNRQTPEKAMLAWHFFRSYYLNHPQAFFYKATCPSPPFHYEMISFMVKHRLNAIAAPRGTSKSTVIGVEYPLLELLAPSIPGIEIGLVLAKDAFVETRFNQIMGQIDRNPRIKEDFGIQRPTKGDGMWNRHFLELNNRSRMVGFSVDGRKRGARPDLIIVDDPEFDPDEGTNVAVVNADLEAMLKREVMGMLMPHSKLFWIGTLLHARSFLYDILRSGKPEYANWNKKIYTAAASPDELTDLLWPERLSKEFLLEQLAVMGKGAWLSEYFNDPRSDAEPILMLDEVNTEYHLVGDPPGVTPDKEINPLGSRQEVRYHDVTTDLMGRVAVTEKVAPFGEVVSGLARYMTVDYASSLDRRHDYSAMVVWGLDSKNTLWILDAWQGRVRANDLIKQIWTLGKKWAIRTVGIEAVSVQDEIRQQVSDFMGLLAQTGEWTPRVRPIRYPIGNDKPTRIEGLEWRFQRGRLKFPSWRKRGGADAMVQLAAQIRDFTPDLSRLPHDDLIDALAMAHYLVHTGGRPVPVKTVGTSIEDRMMSGEMHLKDFPGISLASCMSSSDWTPAMVQAMEENAGQFRGMPRASRVEMANELGPYTDPGDFDDYDTRYYEDPEL